MIKEVDGAEAENAMSIISDGEANEIYQKISSQTQTRKGYIKKNWSEEETRLLKWAVLTYTRQKSISYHSLVSVLGDSQSIKNLDHERLAKYSKASTRTQ